MNTTEIKKRFIDKYGESSHELRIFHAPGRVNLIGEHIDYNGGYVLPAALEFGTTLILRARNDDEIHFASTNLSYEVSIPRGEIGNNKTDEWVDYPVGVMVELAKKEVYPSSGYDLLYHGAIPNGAGLSSSASIEVVAGYALLTAEKQETNTVEISLLSPRAENNYVVVH
ncbi:galactokinase, partial [Paenibacillus sp. 28ISP30-2]|nr:galactokinase [Paenibacillus sp. 28ISP30-2]